MSGRIGKEAKDRTREALVVQCEDYQPPFSFEYKLGPTKESRALDSFPNLPRRHLLKILLECPFNRDLFSICAHKSRQMNEDLFLFNTFPSLHVLQCEGHP
ncbi:unnamed protein product [Caenorhabditis sp. 36 PRJEB53466]|nr:unnamed protein product [Caenorhabditis sp. 36 PRJEB53466]